MISDKYAIGPAGLGNGVVLTLSVFGSQVCRAASSHCVNNGYRYVTCRKTGTLGCLVDHLPRYQFRRHKEGSFTRFPRAGGTDRGVD